MNEGGIGGLRELSLFSGAGGGLLGTKLLGWTAIGYVENNEYCQKVLRQRIADGFLDAAPIFGDIRKFISEGYAASYQGMVDVLSAGFPCQPFSVSGKRKGEEDSRNMWPETIKSIREVKPKFCFLENVPGLIFHPYFKTILSNLYEAGYDIDWPEIIAAADVGASQIRERVWILAHSKCIDPSIPIRAEEKVNFPKAGWSRSAMGYDLPTWPPKRRDYAKWDEIRKIPDESYFPGMAHGMAHRMDRIKAIGNGQVPAVVKTAWRLMGPQ